MMLKWQGFVCFLIFLGMTFAGSLKAAAAVLEAGAPAKIASEDTSARKLQRGFLNAALSPIEISSALQEQIKKDRFPPSWFYAVGKGAFAMTGRALIGVYEILTFPIAQKPLV